MEDTNPTDPQPTEEDSPVAGQPAVDPGAVADDGNPPNIPEPVDSPFDAQPESTHAPEQTEPTPTSVPPSDDSETQDDDEGVSDALARETADGPGESLPEQDDEDASSDGSEPTP